MSGDASLKYVPSSARGIFLTGLIDQGVVSRLIPEIVRLHASPGPVTVYIDSIGGNVFHAGLLRDLLRSRDLEGNRHEFVAVVTGVAASAAADFLATADYAFVFDHSRIVYHGTRRSTEEDLTHESAMSLADNLKRTNERFARDLAERTFKRLIFRLLLFKAEFDAYRANHRKLEPLILKIREKLTPGMCDVLDEAMIKQDRVSALSASIKFPKRKTPLSDAEFEVVLFNAIAKSNLRDHKKDHWLLSEGGLAEVSRDFHLICDFYFGDDMLSYEKWVDHFFPFFLNDDGRKEMEEIPESEPESRRKYLYEKVGPQIRPLWYLTVSIARILQSRDHTLSPRDAYWLGLVDEVIGSSLPNMRTLLSAGGAGD